MSKSSLLQAVTMAGGQTRLARGIRAQLPGSKVSQVSVWGWINEAKFEVPPAEMVLPICRFLEYRMSPHQLRPDLYPNPCDGLPKAITFVPDSPRERRIRDQRRAERRGADTGADSRQTDDADEATT